MIKQSNAARYLLVAGAVWLGVSQIINHQMVLSDSINGLLTGAGIGLLLLALIIRQQRH